MTKHPDCVEKCQRTGCTVDCLLYSLAESAYIDQGWQRYRRGFEGFCEAHELAPDGRLIHYKEPEFEWRKK